MFEQLHRSIIVLLLIVFGISSNALADDRALHPTLQKSDLPELIPTEVFFRDRPTSYFHRISPDGKRLLWVSFTAGRPRIQFRPIDGGETQTLNARAPGAFILWARDNRRIIFLRDKDGDENHHLYVVDTERPKRPERDLTPFDGVKVRWQQIFPDDPSHLLILMNKRERTLFDLYRINIETGALELIAENPGDVLQWITDVKGRTVARYRRLASGGWILEVPSGEEAKWRTLITGTFEESHSYHGHPIDGMSMLALSNVGRDRTSLVRVDLSTGRESVIYSNPKVDLDQLWVDDETYKPIRASAWPGYWDFHYFDEELGADVAVFQQNEPTVVRVPSTDRSKTTMIVNVTTDHSGTSVYLYDRKTKTKTLLATPPIAKYGETLSKTKPISFRSRDGLELNGYLTIPHGTAGRNLPMVLKVHGGPWARDVWGYDADIQFFANRGYAVLQVNYRGSLGYGKEFVRGIKREFAGKAHDDLIDGVNWAIKEGIADPAKIAIYGRSYGGYASLVGLTFTPEVFAAGIDVVGISDLVTTLKNFPPYWKLWLHQWRIFVGNPDDPRDERDLAARSPINFIDRVKRPLLVAQGANDVRVIRENSDRLVAEMKKRDLSVEYLLFNDEGHRIVKNTNRLLLAQRMEAFLSNHLGGRRMVVKE